MGNLDARRRSDRYPSFALRAAGMDYPPWGRGMETILAVYQVPLKLSSEPDRRRDDESIKDELSHKTDILEYEDHGTDEARRRHPIYR